MIKRYLLFTLSTLISLASCGQQKGRLTYQNSSEVAANLIQVCLDATLQLDKGLNTGNFLVDFAPTKQLNRQGINAILRTNPFAKEANLNSLIAHDSTWIQYGYFRNAVIRFEKIEVRKDGTILINTSKTKASDGSIGTEIILQKKDDGFECISKAITWVS